MDFNEDFPEQKSNNREIDEDDTGIISSQASIGQCKAYLDGFWRVQRSDTTRTASAQNGLHDHGRPAGTLDDGSTAYGLFRFAHEFLRDTSRAVGPSQATNSSRCRSPRLARGRSTGGRAAALGLQGTRDS